MDKDVYDQSLLCMWNVKNTMCQRIQLLDLNIPDFDEFEDGSSALTRQEIAIPHSTPMLQVVAYQFAYSLLLILVEKREGERGEVWHLGGGCGLPVWISV